MMNSDRIIPINYTFRKTDISSNKFIIQASYIVSDSSHEDLQKQVDEDNKKYKAVYYSIISGPLNDQQSKEFIRNLKENK
ncbi:MAG: hypothetical protein GX293_13125 [Bacteroidales bacterium]|nr:hypothetical protein [Bacteroidales bacterium]